MPTFTAIEFNSALQETGRAEVYIANDSPEAARHCLYTKRLKNGRATLGPTGRVVHMPDGSQWVVVKERERT